MVRTRKNVWSLPPGDPTLTWYARAVAAMKARPIEKYNSWRYQAAVHDYDLQDDPLRRARERLPSQQEQDTYWSKCQHNSWYFLPWHRMYLHHFETMVAAEIQGMGGPADWALPYWNYSQGGSSSLLPAAFRNPAQVDGTPNPLFVAQRDPRANAGLPFAGRGSTDLRCLLQPVYEGPATGASFGGPETVFHHGGGSVGALEITPHGSMHGDVAGQNGWMGSFLTAALDPVFWLHHANIDRLWEVWLQRNPNHRNPTNPRWLGAVRFAFRDAAGAAVVMTPAQVQLTTTAPLSYTYDDLSDPLQGRNVPLIAAAGGPPMPTPQPPRLAGATDTSFSLQGRPTQVHFAAPAAVSATLALNDANDPSETQRVFLNVENIKSTQPAPSYNVYLNPPPGANNLDDLEDYRVGQLAMFGLVEASRGDQNHPGSGLHYVLDVTETVARLEAENRWDPADLKVSFVPTRDQPDAQVEVGRLSLYIER